MFYFSITQTVVYFSGETYEKSSFWGSFSCSGTRPAIATNNHTKEDYF